MTQRDIKDTLTRFKEGKLSLDEAVLALKEQPFVDLGFAKYDSHRALRQGPARSFTARARRPSRLPP